MNNPCAVLVERLEHLRVKELDRRGSSDTLNSFVHAKAARRPGAPAIAPGRAGSSAYWDSRTANWAGPAAANIQLSDKELANFRLHDLQEDQDDDEGDSDNDDDDAQRQLTAEEACRRVLEAW